MAKRQNFGRAARSEIAERAKNAVGEPHCEWCFAVTRKRHLHHLAQDAMKRPEGKRKPLAAADGVLICIPCHKEENDKQAVEFNKAERVRANYNGVARKPSVVLRSGNNLRRGKAEPKRLDSSKIANGVPAIARMFGKDGNG